MYAILVQPPVLDWWNSYFKENELDKDLIEAMKKHVLEEFDSVKEILWENGVDIKGVEFLETHSR